MPLIRDERDKSLSERLPEYIFTRVHEDIGRASMCWNPIPSGIFKSEDASIIAFNLCHFIADELDKVGAKNAEGN